MAFGIKDKNSIKSITVVLIIFLFLSMLGIFLTLDSLYQCEQAPSSGCPFITCASEDQQCGNLPFIYENGTKKCMDNADQKYPKH